MAGVFARLAASVQKVTQAGERVVTQFLSTNIWEVRSDI